MLTFCVLVNAGFNPVWEETLSFTLHMPEVALIRFLVWDHDPIGRDFVGQRTVAFSSLMPGMRNSMCGCLFNYRYFWTCGPLNEIKLNEVSNIGSGGA